MKIYTTKEDIRSTKIFTLDITPKPNNNSIYRDIFIPKPFVMEVGFLSGMLTREEYFKQYKNMFLKATKDNFDDLLNICILPEVLIKCTCQKQDCHLDYFVSMLRKFASDNGYRTSEGGRMTFRQANPDVQLTFGAFIRHNPNNYY